VETLKIFYRTQVGKCLKSGKDSLIVMPFLLTSKCSHIKDITGRPEDIKKTMMASETTEDAMVLKEMIGKLHTC